MRSFSELLEQPKTSADEEGFSQRNIPSALKPSKL